MRTLEKSQRATSSPPNAELYDGLLPRSLMMQMLSECNGRSVQNARISIYP